MLVPQWIIEKKRDGKALAPAEIRSFINAYADGSLPDYQMSALAMAIYFQGMSPDEIAVLTDAMMRSGDLVDTSSLTVPVADKHSTGGIGDKVSLILGPLAAACGLAVPMISGRGLGITGGTLDKFEAIPGYRTNLSVPEFLEVVRQCGCSIIGQTERLAPADRKLYALRDVTATVPSIPLITASIMSKKMAEGIEALVLDVKWGAGAFMKTHEQARELGHSMVRVGASMGKKVSAILTRMDQPLGLTAGNTLEVVESIETLKGRGPTDLVDLTLALTGEMLRLCGKAASLDEGIAQARAALEDGRGLAIFREMVRLHGGNPNVVEDYTLMPTAPHTTDITASSSGFVSTVDADAIGRAVLLLGGGRRMTSDSIDHAVGVSDLIKQGQHIEAGALLARLHHRESEAPAEVLALTRQAFSLSDTPPASHPLITEILGE